MNPLKLGPRWMIEADHVPENEREKHGVNHPMACVEVDGILVRSAGTERIPIPRVIERVRAPDAYGATQSLIEALRAGKR